MINTLVVFGFAAYSILVPSMLADIIDYGTWKSGIELGGTYFSVFTLMGKATMAIGGALGLFIAGGYGFDPAASTHYDRCDLWFASCHCLASSLDYITGIGFCCTSTDQRPASCHYSPSS